MASWLFLTAFRHSLQGYFGSDLVLLGPGLVAMSPHDSKFLFKLKLLVPLVVYCTLHDKKRLARCLNLRFEQTVEVQADSHTKGNVEPFSRAIETCFFLVMALSRNAGTTGTTVIKTSNSFIELVIVRPAAMLTLFGGSSQPL